MRKQKKYWLKIKSIRYSLQIGLITLGLLFCIEMGATRQGAIEGTAKGVATDNEPIGILLTPGSTEQLVLSWQTPMASPVRQVRVTLKDTKGGVLSQTILSGMAQATGEGALEKKASLYRMAVLLPKVNQGNSLTYQFLDGTKGLNVHIYQNKTQNDQVKMAFFGDLQGYTQKQYSAFKVIYDQVEATGVDATLFAGDMVDVGTTYSQWQYFFQAVNGYSDKHVTIATPGNHDAVHSQPYFKHAFGPLAKGPFQSTAFNQTWTMGNVIVAVWDTEDSGHFEQQKQWLNQVFSESKATFKIVLMHRSCYPMFYNESYIRKLATVFETAGADVVLSGHDHIYNRTTMFQGIKQTLGTGVTYIVGGSGSGSKYYDELALDEGRPWKTVLFDTNQPVYVMLTTMGSKLTINAYATDSKGVATLIDQIIVPAKQK